MPRVYGWFWERLENKNDMPGPSLVLFSCQVESMEP